MSVSIGHAPLPIGDGHALASSQLFHHTEEANRANTHVIFIHKKKDTYTQIYSYIYIYIYKYIYIYIYIYINEYKKEALCGGAIFTAIWQYVANNSFLMLISFLCYL